MNNIPKWSGLAIMWITVTGLLAYVVMQMGRLYWPIIFIPAAITFAAVGGEPRKKDK